jgi:2'-5' RNA ligase
MREKSEGSELRLFVACELPSEMKAALTALQDALRRQGAPPVRWVRPGGIHLTLKFLGSVPAQRVTDICAALAPTVDGIRPLQLSLGSLGTFGGRRGARVVWVGVNGDVERAAQLQRRVEEALARLGFPTEERAFSPHLTLARVPDHVGSAERERLWDLTKALAAPEAASVTIREVSLMRSVLGPSGAVYERLAAFPLS